MLLNLQTITKEDEITFGELAEEWLLYKKHQIKESSYFRYKYMIDKYLREILDEVIVRDIENLDLNLMVEDLLKKYNVRTVKNIVLQLKSILSYAEKKYKYNFQLELLISPKVNYKKVTTLKKEEEIALRNYCSNSKEFRDIGLLICMYTGMRIGEICALTWKDIDLENNLIYINRTMERIYVGNKKTIIYIGDPKSKSSIRAIPIVNKLAKLLAKLKSEYHFENNVFLLSGSNKKFIEPRNYQYWFKRRLEKLKIQSYKFHILRHTFATNCIEVGMDAKTLSEILGHSSVEITLNKYVHSSYKIKKKFLEKL